MKITLVRTALAALVPSALAALVACQSVHRSPQPTTDMEEVAGRYALFGIDGKPVPATVEHGGAPVEVRSGTFVIGADGRCSTTTVFVPPSGREVTREAAAVYAKDGPRLTFWWHGAGTTTGTVEGTTFTMDNEGMVFVYRR